DALRASGLPKVAVDDEVEHGMCKSKPPRVGLTTTSEVVGGGTVLLCLERRTGVPLWVYDAGPGGVGPLLTKDQVAKLDGFDPGVVPVLAAGAVAMAGILLAAMVAALVFGFSRRDLHLPAGEERRTLFGGVR
ncbi:MAG TPA: hypothetical protein VMY34_05635, partial [Acidimicrobiales bacterium]|nr:hypothetical protein [Acidimicrobiales bacterium]